MSEYAEVIFRLAKITDYLELMDESFNDKVEELFVRLSGDLETKIELEFSHVGDQVGEMTCDYAAEMAGYALDHVTESIQNKISETMNEKMDELGEGDDRLLTHHLQDLKSDLSGVADDAAAQLKQLKVQGPQKMRVSTKWKPGPPLPERRGRTQSTPVAIQPSKRRKPLAQV